jgi:hypothetical protein
MYGKDEKCAHSFHKKIDGKRPPDETGSEGKVEVKLSLWLIN